MQCVMHTAIEDGTELLKSVQVAESAFDIELAYISITKHNDGSNNQNIFKPLNKILFFLLNICNSNNKDAAVHVPTHARTISATQFLKKYAETAQIKYEVDGETFNGLTLTHEVRIIYVFYVIGLNYDGN